MIIIDAKGHILGRLGTFAAKSALNGEEVIILNSREIVISGNKKELLQRYRNFRERGIHTKGPFYSRRPDYFVKRAIRGMLPYKKGRGKEAMKSIKCYNGIPKQFEGKKTITLDNAHVSKIPNLKYLSVGEICKHLGGKK